MLNDDSAADSLEEFLPRLYWSAMQAVSAAHGQFVKWTGDGFLAWFETPLERHIDLTVNRVFEAAWHLTLFVNVTQLGVSAPKKIAIKHGVTYEPDALRLEITESGHSPRSDLVGRAVVQAFRLTSLSGAFPNIATQARLARRSRVHCLTFRRRVLSATEKLKFFKGERLGTDAIYVSGHSRPRRGTASSVAKLVRRALTPLDEKQYHESVGGRFGEMMLRGPRWAQDATCEYAAFIRNDLAGNVRKLLPLLEAQMREKRKPPT